MQTDNNFSGFPFIPPGPVWNDENKALALASLHKWHGTPHKNRIAIVGVGIDCIKLIIETLCDAQIITRIPFGSYSVDNGTFEPCDRLQKVVELAFHVKEVPTTEPEFGDLAIFNTGRRSAHIGILDGADIWHALANRMVTHNDFKLWRRDVAKMYRLTAPGWKENPQKAINLYSL